MRNFASFRPMELNEGIGSAINAGSSNNPALITEVTVSSADLPVIKSNDGDLVLTDLPHSSPQITDPSDEEKSPSLFGRYRTAEMEALMEQGDLKRALDLGLADLKEAVRAKDTNTVIITSLNIAATSYELQDWEMTYRQAKFGYDYVMHDTSVDFATFSNQLLEAQFFIVLSLAKRKGMEKAKRELKKWLASFRDPSAISLQMAFRMNDMNAPELAKVALEVAASCRSTEFDAIFMQLHLAELEQNKDAVSRFSKKLEDLARKMLLRDSQNLVAMEAVIVSLMAQGKWEEALLNAKNLLAENPENLQANVAIVTDLINRNHLEKAEKVVGEMLTRDPECQFSAELLKKIAYKKANPQSAPLTAIEYSKLARGIEKHWDRPQTAPKAKQTADIVHTIKEAITAKTAVASDKPPLDTKQLNQQINQTATPENGGMEMAQLESIAKLLRDGNAEEAAAMAAAEYDGARKSGNKILIFNTANLAATAYLVLKKAGTAKNYASIALHHAEDMLDPATIYTARCQLCYAILMKDGLAKASTELQKWLNHQNSADAAFKLFQELTRNGAVAGEVGELAKLCGDYATEHTRDSKQKLDLKIRMAVAVNDRGNSRKFSEEMLLLDPDNLPAREHLLSANLADKNYSEQTRDLALAILTKKPDSDMAKFALANFFWDQKQVEAASRLFEELYENGEYHEQAFKCLANLAQQQGQTDRAVQLVEKELATEKNNLRALDLQVKILMMEEKWPEALPVIEKLTALLPGYAPSQAMLAIVQFKLGNYEKSLEAAKKFHAAQYDDLYLERHVLCTFYSLEEYDLAREAAERILKRAPEDIAALQAMLFDHKVLEQMPDDPQSLEAIITLYCNNKMLDQAETLARHYLDLAPQDEQALNLLIQICCYQDKIEEAEILFQGLITQHPASDKIAALQEILQKKKSFPADETSLQTISLPVRTKKRNGNGNGNGKKTAAKPQDPETRGKTILAADTHQTTLNKWKALINPNSDRCFEVHNQKGFDAASCRKNQILVAEIKSINTSAENERAEVLEAIAQTDAYTRAYIKPLPECAGKLIRRIIVLSHKPNFVDQKGSFLQVVFADAEAEGAYFLLWFEGDQICGSEPAMAVYEDYLTC
jgi:predicted Zn-dependent protease